MKPKRNGPMRKLAFIVVLAAAFGLAASLLLHRRAAPPSQITRSEALQIAGSYVAHSWIPTEANAFHGVDADGIRVDTPDANFQENEEERGWWIVGQRNIGVPYKWGGFEALEEFDEGLRQGKYAGDVYSVEKRRLLDGAVSKHAVGVDCSGFVSRCWRLPRSYSTRELPQLCDSVADFSDLRPGDIFNRHNAHVRLFAGWTDDTRSRARVYEALAQVQLTERSIEDMIGEGYSAWRYRGMRD